MSEDQQPDEGSDPRRDIEQHKQGNDFQRKAHLTPHPQTRWGADENGGSNQQDGTGRANVDDVDKGAGVREADKKL